ncbi:hypothetical protein VPT02_119 [Vibrio phage VPT02]|uniref:Uncharacterized protein n=1 Tax=Vibrio phage pVp-1 TaxID=1150989 RepID=H6WXB5_9CAUD|nr:hypothetical protein F404_gp024 [Vibrio phage pVp-1]AFB83881.1 hypothetical protein pVp-1_0024 [Vibrio phage pVp-1]QIG60695.1 hypothetical protein VPT02_119 [Vibrio phage VPT02]
MNVNSTTIGATNGAIRIFIDNEEIYGVINLNTTEKYIERYVKDDKGHFIVDGGELRAECVPFDTARVEFDNVVIEVN